MTSDESESDTNCWLDVQMQYLLCHLSYIGVSNLAQNEPRAGGVQALPNAEEEGWF